MSDGIRLDPLDIPRSMVNPLVGPLHMLLQIAFPFACISAVCVLTFELVRYRTMLVIEMPVSFFFGRPPVFVILACWLTTFPRAGMGLLVFTRTHISRLSETYQIFAHVRSQGLSKLLSHSVHLCSAFPIDSRDLKR